MKLYLQLFASKGSSTSTSGGSHEVSSGSSTTDTYAHKEGGSHSTSYGKQWASGKVEDNTQEHRDKYNTDYEEGDKVTDTYDRLQGTLNNKPTFQSTYEDKLNSLYDSIMNRDKFSYDFNADNMYQLYKDQYTTQGKKAMQDTMAQAAALTGGYGSSYSQSAGQQTYQNYLQDLNNMIPTLRDQARNEYDREGQDLYNKYNITSDAYNREYGQYRDQMADWQSDRTFNYGMYSDERNFDYNQFTNERNYWNDEYWKEKNSEWSNYQVTDTNYWEDSQSHSTTNFSNVSDMSNWSNSSTIPMGGGGSGSGAGTSSSAYAQYALAKAAENASSNKKNQVLNADFLTPENVKAGVTPNRTTWTDISTEDQKQLAARVKVADSKGNAEKEIANIMNELQIDTSTKEGKRIVQALRYMAGI